MSTAEWNAAFLDPRCHGYYEPDACLAHTCDEERSRYCVAHFTIVVDATAPARDADDLGAAGWRVGIDMGEACRASINGIDRRDGAPLRPGDVGKIGWTPRGSTVRQVVGYRVGVDGHIFWHATFADGTTREEDSGVVAVMGGMTPTLTPPDWIKALLGAR